MANAFACRSTTRPVWRMNQLGNPLVLVAVAAELALLLGFLGLPALADLLGGSWPSPLGWGAAAAGAAVLVIVDGIAKAIGRNRRPGQSTRTTAAPVTSPPARSDSAASTWSKP